VSERAQPFSGTRSEFDSWMRVLHAIAISKMECAASQTRRFRFTKPTLRRWIEILPTSLPRRFAAKHIFLNEEVEAQAAIASICWQEGSKTCFQDLQAQCKACAIESAVRQSPSLHDHSHFHSVFASQIASLHHQYVCAHSRMNRYHHHHRCHASSAGLFLVLPCIGSVRMVV